MSKSSTSGRESADRTEGQAGAEPSRRDFVRATAATATVGALGGLAGCSGEQGGGTPEPKEGGGGSTGETGSDSGGSESVTIDYLSAQAVENSAMKSHFQESMKTFEEKNGNVSVSLQTASYGDIRSKLSSTVSSGNPPTFAEAGGGGLQFYLNDKVPDHKPFIESTDSLPDDFTAANKESAQYRGEYWSGGGMRNTNSNLGISPKLFSQAGVSNPKEELSTWSGFLDAVKRVDQQTDAIAYEETGVPGDLESYWGYARTAYTDGTDPWMRPGDNPDNPTIVVGNDEHEDQGKTDGMIKTCVKMANQFSSQEAAQRGDEDIPSLMLTGRVASFNYAVPTASRWTATKDDVKFGWQGGNGDFMLLPHPKVDPQFGQNFGISDLEGVEGEHGGHMWALEQQQCIFQASDAKQQAAWDLNMFLLSDNEFVLPAWGEHYEAIPGLKTKLEAVLNEYDLAQSTEQAYKNADEYGVQYSTTGASWDVRDVDPIRWTDINETLSQAIAGQHSAEETPGLIRQRIQKRLGQ
ncbi:ABC transporter substrate-binding protein [Halopelagius longus]|uniref:ABC-type glycerol-3-phosphate transport system, substrate-binding protein n=1 Tax=Halopelagius longus TaxID=1236180 RepID=A0A1H1FG35_9EURY|nr:extracellular solute-binding protein [Halopelagius longus]RDI70125.1 extracellular solute-binding protein [Halopelagius longus]SDQ99699.1 ABC-type glycerol-3-phosphate transport system, substrate-binding protein [Halopelagius longus]